MADRFALVRSEHCRGVPLSDDTDDVTEEEEVDNAPPEMPPP